jgi:multidrug resistance efflux pump
MSQNVFKLLRFVLIVGLVGGLTFWLYDALFREYSYKGYVNGKITHLRSPIRGAVKLNPLTIGDAVSQGQTLAVIENDRAYELLTTQTSLDQRTEANRAMVQTIDNQIQNRQAWLSELGQESSQQKQLRVSFENQQLTTVEAQLVQSKNILQKASADATRYATLAEKGYAPKAVAEEYRLKQNEADALLKAKESEKKAIQARIQAAKANVQIDGSLAKNYAESRRFEVETEILRLQQERARLVTEAQTSQTQLAELSSPQVKMSQTAIVSPVNGVVWGVNAYSKEHVSADQSIVEILDCEHLWIDTYINERQLPSLDLKAPVEVKLLSHSEMGNLKGKVLMVRTGVGRVTVNEDVAPPNDQMKSQAVIRIAVDWPKSPDPSSNCYVGTSVKARFSKKGIFGNSILASVL